MLPFLPRLGVALILVAVSQARAADPPLVRSATSGAWSDAKTWEGNAIPPAGSRVLIRPGHRVVYDRKSDEAIRSVHVGGTLGFAPDRDTLLAVGLLKIQPGEDCREEGFDCEAHGIEPPANQPRPALEVGTQDRPIDAKHTATIRLVLLDGMNKETLPAIVCCGGRMDLHGAPLSRTWLKLGANARKGDESVTLSEAVRGWKVGDHIIVTGTKDPAERDAWQTEERIIKAIDGANLTLDVPLKFEHTGEGEYRGEVANLSRNVVIESAEPEKARGHTMYHRHSAGSIAYAEFRHLGKQGVLGK